MVIKSKTVMVLVFIIGLFTMNSQAQIGYFDEVNLDQPRFDINFAAFKSDLDGMVNVELYYKIYNNGLRFFKKDDQFVSHYELNIIVLGEDDKQITGASVERYYRLDNYQDTRNPNDFLINLVNLQIGTGKYKFVCKLIDKNSNKIGSIEREFEINNLFKEETSISYVEFVREVLPIDTLPSRFDKGEKRIIPAVSREYGDDIKQISFYMEIYHTPEDSLDARLDFTIHNSNTGKKTFEDMAEIVLDKSLIRYLKHISLDEFLPGEYDLTVELKESSGKLIQEVSSQFRVAWSLTALVKNDYDLALEQLKFIAQKDEMEELKNAPEAEREQAFRDFWKSKDRTPETPFNETMEKYYFRIRHANKFFSSLHKEGWRTDMGMIYIIYGEPDNVERHPFELDQKPYQIWYYYSLSRTFGFVDEIGTGEYELQFPYDGRRGFIDDKMDDYD